MNNRVEALREIERKRQGFAAADWPAWLDHLESWVADLLEDAADLEEAREEAEAEARDEYDRGYERGRADLVDECDAHDERDLKAMTRPCAVCAAEGAKARARAVT